MGQTLKWVLCVLASGAWVAPALADIGPHRPDPTVSVVARVQGACEPAAAKQTAKKLRSAFAICADERRGKATFTFASSAAGKAQQVKQKGTFNANVLRCMAKRIENAAWPKSKACDLEIEVSAR